MYKKVVKYTDWDGVEHNEALYFNLTEAELTKMDIKANGLKGMLTRIIEAENKAQVVQTMEDIILMAYGEKSTDGKRFVKSKEAVDAFKASEAYSVLFMELITNEKAAVEFVTGIVPAELREAAAKAQKDGTIKEMFPQVDNIPEIPGGDTVLAPVQ